MNDGHEERLQRFRVLDLNTMGSEVFIGYTDNRGRSFAYTERGERRISYVDLGVDVQGVSAIHVLKEQLDEDHGLYRFVERAKLQRV